MKNLTPFKVLLSCLVLLSVVLVRAAEIELKLGYSDIESYPFQMGNSPDVADPPGLALDIISKAASELSITVLYERLPNRRVLSTLESGRIDGAFIFSYKPERELLGVYPIKNGNLDAGKRIATISYYLYQRGKSVSGFKADIFKGIQLPVGAIAGYSIVGDLRKQGVPVHEVANTHQLFGMLELNRVSYVAAQNITADPFLVKQKYQNIHRIDPPLKTKDYFLIFSHQFVDRSPEIVLKLWDEIAEIRDKITNSAITRY